GKMVGALMTKDANERILAEMMVGREVLFEDLEKKEVARKEVLRAENLQARNNRGRLALKGVSFSLYSGEILGIAGVEGNGQSELLEVLTGLRQVEKGTITINGNEAANKDSLEIRELGLSHIPEDRLSTGLS